MPDKIRIYPGDREIDVITVPRPAPEAEEVVVRVEAPFAHLHLSRTQAETLRDELSVVLDDA